MVKQTQPAGSLLCRDDGNQPHFSNQLTFRVRANSDSVYLLFVISLLSLSLIKHIIDRYMRNM